MTDAEVRQEDILQPSNEEDKAEDSTRVKEDSERTGAEETTQNKSRSVSFNKDVHVKRFGTSRPSPNPPVAVEPSFRKKPLHFTKEQLAEEAARVLKQASSTHCSSSGSPDKFYSLPNRKKHRPKADDNSYFPTRRKSEELGVTSDLPKRSPKALGRSNSDVSAKKQRKLQKSPLLNLFKKSTPDISKSGELQPKKVTVKRSKSDVSDLKSNNSQPRIVRKRAGSESEEYLNSVVGKKSQLSPIIEINQPEDYFKNKKSADTVDKEVKISKEYKINPIEKPPRTNQYIKPPVRPSRSKSITSRDLSVKDKKKTAQVFGTLPKAKTPKKLVIDEVDVRKRELSKKEVKQTIKEAITSLEKSKEEKPLDMIHSSQRPPEKLPLTKGHTVDSMVRILNNDKFSPPPKATLLMSTSTAAHNNNQPFSYTKPSVSPDPNLYVRSVSPDRVPSPINKGIIYAQVVSNENQFGTKQTIHTTVNPGRQGKFGQISDEDEGLGYDKYIDQTDDFYRQPDSPITPRFKEYNARHYDEEDHPHGDVYPGHDYENFEKARERRDYYLDENERKIADLSYRRDLLESRLNARKLRDRSMSPGQTPDKDIGLGLESRTNFLTETIIKNYEEHELKENDIDASYSTKTSNRSKFNPKTSLFETVTDYEIDRREFIDRRLAEEPMDSSYFTNIKTRKYFPPEPEYDPPSLDSQTSKTKYSPERKFKPKTSKNYVSQDALHKYNSKNREKFNDSRDRYASNPEITKRDRYTDYNDQYDNKPETFHNSLKRQRYENTADLVTRSKYEPESSGPESSRSRYDGDNKLVDSGIENDYRKDSNGDIRHKSEFSRKYKNDSEDEGFASSLLITGERRHHRGDSPDKKYSENSTLKRDNFVHRERSIDDGSFYDPRLDKFEPKTSRSLSSKPPKATKKISGLEKVKQLFSRDSSKKSKKEKTVFSRDDEKKMVNDEDLRRRFTEFRGSQSSGDEYRDNGDRINGHLSDMEYGSRRRLATPDHSPKEARTDTLQRTKGWFKSLDRLATKKNRNGSNDTTEEESHVRSRKSYQNGSSKPVTKNLRFFGDSDPESNIVGPNGNSKNSRSTNLTNSRKKISSSVQALDRSNIKNNYRSSSMSNLPNTSQNFGSRQNIKDKYSSNTRRNLHNINEIHSNSETESQFEDSVRKQSVYKQHSYDLDSRRVDGVRKPPVSPYREQRSRSHSNSKTLNRGYSNADLHFNDELSDLRLSRQNVAGSKNDLRSRRRRVHNGASGSPGDSSTEGDSSHQSQKSVVYLHAPTVGDIPVRRSQGKPRDDISSIASSKLQPQKKTVTRSFSVLAPWKPRYYKEGYDINYSQTKSSTLKRPEKSVPKSASLLSKGRTPSTKNLSSSRCDLDDKSRKGTSSTLSRYSKSNGTHVRRSDSSSKENVADVNISRDPYKKRISTERERLSRSISMPKDPNKSAGWFKINTNKKNKKSESTNRLY